MIVVMKCLDGTAKGHQLFPLLIASLFVVIQGGFAKCYELNDIQYMRTYAGKIISKSRLTKDNQKDKVWSHSLASHNRNRFHQVEFRTTRSEYFLSSSAHWFSNNYFIIVGSIVRTRTTSCYLCSDLSLNIENAYTSEILSLSLSSQ